MIMTFDKLLLCLNAPSSLALTFSRIALKLFLWRFNAWCRNIGSFPIGWAFIMLEFKLYAHIKTTLLDPIIMQFAEMQVFIGSIF